MATSEKPAGYITPKYAVRHGIPDGLYRDLKRPVCRTVGELADLLAKLPRNLRLNRLPRSDRAGVELSLANIRDSSTRSLDILDR